MFAADVAVEDQDEIAQDSSCMLGHSQGTFCRVAGFRIDTTAPAVGLSRVPQKTTKTTLHTIWYRICLFLAARTRKKNKKNNDSYSYLLVQQANYYLEVLRYITRKIKSNPLEPHFETSATMSRCLERTKTSIALPHCCSEST